MRRRKKDIGLVKVIIAIVVVGGGAFCVPHVLRLAREGALILRSEASAASKVAEARGLVTQGRGDEARELLERVVSRTDEGAGLLEGLTLLADLEQQRGNGVKAKEYLEQAYRKFSNSPRHPEIAVSYARLLEDSGNIDKAVRVYEEVRKNAPRELRAPALTGLGRHAERDQDLLKARELYRQAVADAQCDGEVWNEALDALGRVNVALVFSPVDTPESKRYVVKVGDSITGIGNSLNTTQGMLMRANELTEKSVLRIGQRLKYSPKDFRIVIERAKLRLLLIDKDGIFKRYSVGLGRPGHETTLGAYKIGNKQKDPVWHKPGEGPIPAGDPRNELGTRWMPLAPDAEGLPKDLGIHGTIARETVGQYCSNGCARLWAEDVEELYDLVVRATPVEVVETFQGREGGQSEDLSSAVEPPEE